MKKLFLIFITLILILSVKAQDKVTKQGWKLSGLLPTVTFDSDLGFQYGGLVDFSNYGDGSRYPVYDHHLYFEISRYTKGSGINRFYYDSDKLIKGMLVFVDLSYLTDQAYDFYGFNGYDAVYNAVWTDDTQPASIYRSRMFYKYDRKMFRFKSDLQGKISGEHLRWSTGLTFLNFKLDTVNLAKLNKGRNEGDEKYLRNVEGLYEKYVKSGIIPEKEANGGFVPTIKAGVVYDTRDFKNNPMKGIWTEVVLEGATEFLGAESSFMKLSVTHREYFTITPKNLSLAYRLNYQTTIAGHAPFYYQTQVLTSELRGAVSEGLGGGSTLRGVLRNRVVGDGYFLGNIEARWKFIRFQIGNNDFYLGLNGFMDFGRVTNKIDVNTKNFPTNDHNYLSQLSSFFKNDAEKMHYSYGAGLRVVMNETFIVKMDTGFAIDKQDGEKMGIYIGLNYLF